MCAFGLAAALVAAVGPPAQEPPAEAASHTPRDPGQVWVAATAGPATWQWEHVNLWRCDETTCSSDLAGSGASGDFNTSDCQNRAATAAAAGGCGGHSAGGGWSFRGHVMCYSAQGDAVPSSPRGSTNWPAACAGRTRVTGSKVDGSALYACTATGAPVSDPADCGAWSSCSSTTVPNAARTLCVPCPSGQEPDPGDRDSCRVRCLGGQQHRHGSGECEDNHRYGAAGPPCPTGNTQPVTLTWTYHNAAKENATGTKTCGVPRCPDGQHRHGATGACGDDHPHGPRGPVCATGLTVDTTVQWVYHNTAGADTDGEKICPRAGSGGGGGAPQGVDCAATQNLVRPFGKVRNFPKALYDASLDEVRANAATPHPLSSPAAAPWLPRVQPAGPVDAAAGEPFEVAAWIADFTGADRPTGWTRSGRFVQQPGEVIPTWQPGSEIYKTVTCARVTVAHAGAGWRLTNLALADPEAATSGTGRGRRTFTAAGLVDDTKPAGFAAYDRWTVTVELAQSVGAPFPPCTFSAWFLASGGTNADPRLGVTAAGTARPAANPHRSCSWTVTLWDAAVVRLNPCGKDRRPAVLDDDGNVLRHQDLRGAVRDSDGNVLYCAWPGV